MPSDIQRARVRAYAKINLNLEVLHRRPDGYHEIRTILQTISLHDDLDISFTLGRASGVTAASEPEIPGNLVVHAAEIVLERSKARGHVNIALRKRVPMGAGLGGGSSDAAAVLLALPVLTGHPISATSLYEIAAALGSDVPFFLTGGCGLGVGRGERVYPLDDPPPLAALVVDPQIHVSTADAYAKLGRALTSPSDLLKIDTSWRFALGMGAGTSPRAWARGSNDFEPVVFSSHPRLQSIKRKLLKLGAECALLSGSGASVFGVFESREKRNEAIARLSERALPVSLIGRRAYRQAWRRSLKDHIADDQSWPPRSRYAR